MCVCVHLMHVCLWYSGNLSTNGISVLHLWQSWVEIEHYSVAYFEHVATLEAL